MNDISALESVLLAIVPAFLLVGWYGFLSVAFFGSALEPGAPKGRLAAGVGLCFYAWYLFMPVVNRAFDTFDAVVYMAIPASGWMAFLASLAAWGVRHRSRAGDSRGAMSLNWLPRIVLVVCVLPVFLLAFEYPDVRRREFYVRVVEAQMRDLIDGMNRRVNSDSADWPDTLDDLVREGYVQRDLLENPCLPQHEVGYVYLKPSSVPGAMRDPRLTPVLYERFPSWPSSGLVVGFGDGITRLIEDRDEFRRVLMEAPAVTDTNRARVLHSPLMQE